MLNTKKRLTSLILSLIMILGVFAYFPMEIKVNAATGTSSSSGNYPIQRDRQHTNQSNYSYDSMPEGFLYTICDDGTICVDGYNGTETDLIIPSEIDGMKVSEICEVRWYDLTSLVIPDSVTYIGMNTFSYIPTLTKVIIPDSVHKIDRVSFAGTGITSFTIPEGNTAIEEFTFSDCTQLTEINIPASLTSINPFAFARCPALTDLNVDENNPNYTTINGFLYNKELTKLLYWPTAKLQENSFPSTVTAIGDEVIAQCTEDISVTIPDGIETIGYMFFDLYGALDITIPKSVTYIEEDALDSTNTTIYGYSGSYAETYAEENEFTFVSIGTVQNDFEFTILEDGTAELTRYSGDLTEVNIPEQIEGYTVTSISGNTFEYCYEITTISIPATIKKINTENAFSMCVKLTEISVSPDNENYSDIDGVLFNKTKTTLLSYPIGKPNTKYEIPYGTTSIAMLAFGDSLNLNSVIISDTVNSIGESAFSASNLTSVFIPSNVTSIGYNAFYACDSLTKVTIAPGITTIPQGCFGGCDNLNSITIPQSVTTIESSVFTFIFLNKLTVYGYSDSYANTWVQRQNTTKKAGITFIALEDTLIITDPTNTSTNTTTTTTPTQTTTSTTPTQTTTSTTPSKTITSTTPSQTTTSTTPTQTTTSTTPTETTTTSTSTTPSNTTTPIPESKPTKLSVTVKSVTPSTAKIYLERTSGEAKGALSYVLLKGDYSETDFSTSTISDMKNHPDFVSYQISKWQKNCNLTQTYLEKNQTYTIVPFTVKMKYCHFDMGENTTFTTPDITLETTIKKITADTVKFRLSRTGTANGALGYVLLKGDYSDISYKNLEEYTSMPDFISYRTSNWTGGVTITNNAIESGETYTIIPYTQKKGNYYFGLGENTVFTAK